MYDATSPYRIPRLLSKVEELWLRHPDWRFGQLIEIAFNVVHEPLDIKQCIYNVPDDEADRLFSDALSSYGNSE